MCQNNIKLNTRLVALLLVALLLVATVPAVSAAETSGSCGANLTWSFDGSTLTVTGSGDMTDYREYNRPPWYEFRDKITAVRFPEGMTSVGDLAFYECSALTSVTLPDSVKEVGWHSFAYCTSLTMLNLGKVQRIEDAAFRDCVSLKSLRLPGTLTVLEYQAFYRCESLREVVIPISVTELGMTAFAYCTSLVRAEVRAEIRNLPDWTFYGCTRLAEVSLPAYMTGVNEYAFHDCESLNVISYAGSKEDREKIVGDISEDINTGLISISNDPLPDSAIDTTIEESEDSVAITTTTTTTTDNSSLTTEYTVTNPTNGEGETTTAVQVEITLENSTGWAEVQDLLDQALLNDETLEVDVEIYLKDSTQVSGEVLDALAGETNTVTVHDSSGAVWKVEGTQLKEENVQQNFNFSHQRLNATAEQLTKMGCTLGFQIVFNQSAEINAEVLIRLPVEYTRCIATLYQVDSGTATLLQSVIVDNIGYAHFYLGAVNMETEYLIGIDVPGVDSSTAIVPEELYGEYGITDLASPIEYVITGRTSSWGMSGWQVTWILVGVLVACVVGVGVFMYALNKRKLKMGYVPEVEDDEDDEA